MSRLEKLETKLKSRPKDFTYAELKKLLKSMGYKEEPKGKSSGSRVAFIHEDSRHIIRIHKLHPGNIIKEYVIEYLNKELKEQGLI